MSNNPFLSDAGANAAINAITALLNSGSVKIYNGTQPTDANTAITNQVLLVSCSFGATAFAPAAGGVATANAITSGTAVASGTGTWFRCYESNGTTGVYDGSVGTSGCDLNITSTTISSGGTVGISSFVLTLPEPG